MANKIYPGAVAVIAALTAAVDEMQEALEQSGVLIEEIPLVVADRMAYIGYIKFDDDEHAYFEPAE